jgi:hypothetical protein
VKVISHTYEMVDRAFEKALRRKALSGSITRGKASAAGYLGEIAVAAYLDAKIVSDSESNHDLILKDGRTCEIKTKRRTVPPIGTYEVSVASASMHQQPDLYAFVSLHFRRSCRTHDIITYHDLVAVWLLGYKEPRDYFLDSKLWNPGDMDLGNGFRSHVEMYNLPIHRLDPVHDISI